MARVGEGRGGRKLLKAVDEFYAAVDELIEMMRSGGFKAEARALHDLLHETAWTTGSELVGELGLALAEMKEEYPEDIRKRIEGCRQFVIRHRRILGLD
jgi:hypothetical protein